MKKTRVHGEIRDKFVIEDTSSGLLVMETERGRQSPAIFNSKEDAERYLEAFDLDEEDKKEIIIKSTDISFFNQGGILVTFE